MQDVNMCVELLVGRKLVVRLIEYSGFREVQLERFARIQRGIEAPFDIQAGSPGAAGRATTPTEAVSEGIRLADCGLTSGEVV